MDTFLGSLLSCCGRRKATDEDDLEQSRQLIPPQDEQQIITYGSGAVDNHAKERLNVIVRSKQGKMVNVLSRVPFNLRNDPVSGQGNTSSPSRSTRSVSANLNRTNARLIEDSSRASSPKPSPSISRSESVSSFHHASTSHTLLEDGPSDREPILKARLVPTNKSKQRNLGRRGRSKTRQGRFADAEAGDNGVPVLEGIQSVDSGRVKAGPDNDRISGDSYEAGELDSEPTAERPNVAPLGEEDEAIIKGLSGDISAILKDGFKLQDVGSLALSWGE